MAPSVTLCVTDTVTKTAKVTTSATSVICPTCGRSYPAGNITKALDITLEEMAESWNVCLKEKA